VEKNGERNEGRQGKGNGMEGKVKGEGMEARRVERKKKGEEWKEDWREGEGGGWVRD